MKQSINQCTQLEFTFEFESDMSQSEIDYIVAQFEYGYSNYDDFINDEEVQPTIGAEIIFQARHRLSCLDRII